MRVRDPFLDGGGPFLQAGPGNVYPTRIIRPETVGFRRIMHRIAEEQKCWQSHAIPGTFHRNATQPVRFYTFGNHLRGIPKPCLQPRATAARVAEVKRRQQQHGHRSCPLSARRYATVYRMYGNISTAPLLLLRNVAGTCIPVG